MRKVWLQQWPDRATRTKYMLVRRGTRKIMKGMNRRVVEGLDSDMAAAILIGKMKTDMDLKADDTRIIEATQREHNRIVVHSGVHDGSRL